MLAVLSVITIFQRLIAGAKKEGVVNIYSSITVDDMKVISSGFEKKYGIKLQAWRASSEDILQRVLVGSLRYSAALIHAGQPPHT